MLMIERSQLAIQCRVRSLQFATSAEKGFGSNGEEFDAILRTVRIENRGLAGVYCASEALVFITEYLTPRRMLARFQEWRTIGDVVLEVELMREFVNNNVATRVATLAPAWDVVPRNDDCAKPKTGFAQASVVAFFPNAVTKVALTADYV